METSTREALISLVNAAYVAAYPLVPIVYDNVAFDRNTPPDAWVEFNIEFTGGNQVGMSADPKTRLHGFVYVSVWCREGKGWKTASLMRDWFASQMKYKSSGGVNLQAPEPVGGKGPTGWDLKQIKFYFYTGPA